VTEKTQRAGVDTAAFQVILHTPFCGHLILRTPHRRGPFTPSITSLSMKCFVVLERYNA
jgi:hypothetical protein